MIVDAIKRGDSRVELPPVQQFGGALACVYVTRDGEVRRAERYGEWFDRPARISLEPGPKRADGFRLFDLPDIESSPYGLVGLSNEARSLKKQAVSAWGSHA
jgi:hypothetical protein